MNTAAQTAANDVQRTDWIAFNHAGCTHYRIWTEFDGRTWWQRHEWKRADGTTTADNWIHGTGRHCANSTPIHTA